MIKYDWTWSDMIRYDEIDSYACDIKIVTGTVSTTSTMYTTHLRGLFHLSIQSIHTLQGQVEISPHCLFCNRFTSLCSCFLEGSWRHKPMQMQISFIWLKKSYFSPTELHFLEVFPDSLHYQSGVEKMSVKRTWSRPPHGRLQRLDPGCNLSRASV